LRNGLSAFRTQNLATGPIRAPIYSGVPRCASSARSQQQSHIFLVLANHATDRTLWVLASGALVYAVVRAIEAYGLWREREWAQWFALLSTALYVPAELYALLCHLSWLKCSVLVANVVILLYMLTLRVRAPRRGQNSRNAANGLQNALDSQ